MEEKQQRGEGEGERRGAERSGALLRKGRGGGERDGDDKDFGVAVWCV